MRDKAIYNLYPNVVSISNGQIAYDADNNIVRYDEHDVLIEIQRIQDEYNNLLYQRQRSIEYPNIQDQLDMQYWDLVNGTTTWQDTINAVKAKYPKPEGL